MSQKTIMTLHRYYSDENGLFNDHKVVGDNYATVNNRLLATTVGQTTVNYAHNVHGSMTSMPHLSVMDWNYAEQLCHVTKGTTEAYYNYDASGQRVRKVVEKGNITETRLYLGGFEIYRKHVGSTLDTERETLHVMDDQKRIALVETKTWDSGVQVTNPVLLQRYQLDNHLGSASLELDESAAVISYEEYYPYGDTSYQAGRSASEVSQKRYRYTGKEKDEESGLYYHGARYYACWLGRWTAADPIGVGDGVNLYMYCRGNPVGLVDPSGNAVELPECTADPDMVLPSQDVKDLYENDQLRIVQGRAEGSFDEMPEEGGSVGPLSARSVTNEDTGEMWMEFDPVAVEEELPLTVDLSARENRVFNAKTLKTTKKVLDGIGNISEGLAADQILPQRFRLEPARGATLTGIRDTKAGMVRGGKPVGDAAIRVDRPHGKSKSPHINLEVLGKADPHVPISPRTLKALAGTAKVAEGINKVILPVAIAVDATRLGIAIHEDEGFGENFKHTAASVAGGWGGAFAGALAIGKVGAVIGGAIGGPVGLAIGGFVGGILGGIGGAFGGSFIAEKLISRK